METKCLFEIISDVLVGSFRYIWIPMSWVYSHYKYFNSSSPGTVFIRQNLTSTDIRFWRIKTVPALKGLIIQQMTMKNNLLFVCFRDSLGSRKETVCSEGPGREQEFVFNTNAVEVRMVVRKDETSKYFLVEYEGVYCLLPPHIRIIYCVRVSFPCS